MSSQSIYNIIFGSLTTEGQLPNDFSLPYKEKEARQIRFMPGGKDGIGVFHGNANSHEEHADEVVQLLKNDCEKGSADSDTQISELLQQHGALFLIDPILDTIRRNHEGLNVKNLIAHAIRLAFQTTDEELVKLGIALLGLIDLTNEQRIIDGLLTLALYEEFTLYAVVALPESQNTNDNLFALAQKINGWGKIHTVKRLKPATEEIRDWLLRKGCTNTVMDAYLGLECANKGNLIDALRRDSIDAELFDSISIIIDALLDEGPVEGISAYEHAEEALRHYLQFAVTHAVSVKYLWHVLNIQSWLEDADISNKEELEKLCEVITGKSTWQELICEILLNPDDEQFFFAVNTADRLNMDVSVMIYEAVKQSPVKHSGYLSSVYKNPEYAKQMTEIYEEILPLSEMATGMGDYLFATEYSREHSCIDFVLQELRNYPNMGARLVQAALQSPVVRERNGACKVLGEWCKQLEQPLQIVSPSLFSVLSEIAPTEINSATKERMEALLGDE